MLLLSPSANAQGSGKSSIGTGGIHVIQGYIFFPSGRRAEGTIVVKLQSLQYAELQVIPDSSGAFNFSQLAPGSYTVVVDAGNDYEIFRESVYIDSDLNLSRMGVRLPPNPQRHSVMAHLQLKIRAVAKPGVVNAALAAVPEKARKLYERGVEEARSDNAAKAANTLKEAVTLYPHFPLALNELGVQYLKLRQVNKAIEVLREACKLDPDATPARLNLGIALLEAKQFALAEEQLRESLKRNSSSATAHMYLGISLLRQTKFEEAEKELLVATQANATQLGMANYYLAGLYWRKKDYPRAVEQLEKYLVLTPNAPDAERVRATIRDFRSRITPE
ncbi:MAG TPA: tetratricopeptide repeat protein [Pyrinomonadaceae bacterium]|nr:tetratricopeptide repeat protein [Pyrinomonadaceae bacterium]